jgi:hypothetical protein
MATAVPPGKGDRRRTVRFSLAKDPKPDDATLSFSGRDGEIVDRWWRESSSDLQEGLDVSDEDTIPAPLLDELFKPRR